MPSDNTSTFPTAPGATNFGDAAHQMLPGCQQVQITSYWNVRRQQKNKKASKSPSSPHSGTDIACVGGGTEGQVVHSPVDGTVPKGGEGAYPGGISHLDIHNDQQNLTFLFLHMRKHYVHPGMTVHKGDPIGEVGDKGAPGNFHLHHGLKDQYGRFMNPEKYWGGSEGMAHSPSAMGLGYPPGGVQDYRNVPNGSGGATPTPSEGPPKLRGTIPPENQFPYQNPKGGPLDIRPPAQKHRKHAARKIDEHIMVVSKPDVCLTPRGGCMVPVGYHSVAKLGASVRTATSVHINKTPSFNLNSRSTTIKGHAPGSGKGQTVHGYELYSHAAVGSSSVFSEGWSEVRNEDPAWINHPDVGPREPMRELETFEVTSVWPRSVA